MNAREASTWARIGAIARRDTTVQLTYRLNLLLRAEAVFFSVATLVFLARLVPHHALPQYNGGYFAFAAVGLVMTLFTTVALYGVGDAIGSELREGTLESLLCTPTSMTTVILGSLIVPLALATAQAVLVLGVGIGVFGGGVDPVGALLAVPVIVLSIAAFIPMGVLAAAFIIVTKRGDPITAFVSQLSAFLGGAVFPVALMPGWLQAIAHLIPQYYALHGLRAALLGGGHGAVLGDSLALAAFAILLLGPSLWVYMHALHVARATGTLATY